MGRGKPEVEAAIKSASDWYFNEYGVEMTLGELSKYFSERFDDERRRALLSRFESFHGRDLNLAIDVCADLLSRGCRMMKPSAKGKK